MQNRDSPSCLLPFGCEASSSCRFSTDAAASQTSDHGCTAVVYTVLVPQQATRLDSPPSAAVRAGCRAPIAARTYPSDMAQLRMARYISRSARTRLGASPISGSSLPYPPMPCYRPRYPSAAAPAAASSNHFFRWPSSTSTYLLVCSLLVIA